MRKHTTMNLDVDLVHAAQQALGTTQTTETVHRALEEVVRQHRIRALLDCDRGGLTPETLEALRQSRSFADTPPAT